MLPSRRSSRLRPPLRHSLLSTTTSLFPTELVGGARPAADVAPPLATGVTTASNPRRLTDESLLSLDGRKGPEMELVAFCERYKISSTLRERLVKNGYDAPELLPDTCIKDLKEAGFLGGELMRLRNAVTVLFRPSVRGRIRSAVTTAGPRFVRVGHA